MVDNVIEIHEIFANLAHLRLSHSRTPKKISPLNLSAPMSVSVNRSLVNWRSRSVLLQRASRPVVIVFSDSICANKLHRSVLLAFLMLCSSDSQVVRLSHVADNLLRRRWSSPTTSLVLLKIQSGVRLSLMSMPRQHASFRTSSRRCLFACSLKFSSDVKSISSRRCFEHISFTLSSKHRFSRWRVWEVCSLRTYKTILSNLECSRKWIKITWRFFSRVSVACIRCCSEIMSADCRALCTRNVSHSLSLAQSAPFVSVNSFIRRSRL